MNGIVERVDALAKAEGGLSDERLEEILLAEQRVWEVAQRRAAERSRPAATPTSTSTSKAAAAPNNAQLYAALEKRATEAYPTLSTPAAVEKWVLANPGAYTEYCKAETATRDPELADEVWEQAIGRHISGPTATIQLEDMIRRYAERHMVTKGRATTEVLKSTEGLRLYKIHASGRPQLAEREAVTKAQSELQQILAHLDRLTKEYLQEHPEKQWTYSQAHNEITKSGPGYLLFRRALALR